MLTFHRDTLAPPELCRLLYQTIPEAYHVPVIFTIRDRRQARGSFNDHGAVSPYIEINLSVIWGNIAWTGGLSGAMDAQLWYKLLSVCYHEFGHVATEPQWEHIDWSAYVAKKRGYQWVEELADLWKTRRLLHLLDHDPRLGQPRAIGGYIGARLRQMIGQCRKWDNWGSGKVTSLKNWRCYKTGGQLSAGDVARYLRLYRKDSHSYDYAKLRRLSKDIGIKYTDSAGRSHKFYTWGDLAKLTERMGANHA